MILQAVNENNYELAQRTVDSEVRKSPTSDVYLSLKVYVASGRNDRNQALEVAERAVQVCSKKTLEMFLLPVLVDYNAKSLLAAAFVRVNRQVPLDHEVCEAWLETSLLVGDLSSAQKALMAMQRTSKKHRSVCYQSCFIMAMDNSNPKLFPTLAMRMLEKYMPAKTPQECYAVAMVQKMTSMKKLVEYLTDADVFAMFVSGTLGLQLLLLNGLIETQRWSELIEYAQTQLKRIDSYNYWQALNTACVELGKPEISEKFASQFSSTNSLLSRVDLAMKTKNNEELIEAVTQFWTLKGSKPSAYKYLKPSFHAAGIDPMKLPSNTLSEKINQAKLASYAGAPLKIHELIKIYEDHQDEIPDEKTDYFIGTDALIMAAQELIRESKIGCHLVLAAVVLEGSLLADPHNFYVRLLLVLIYRSLGAFNRASDHFKSLNIRNVQLDTLGYLLSTRIASTAPEAAKAVVTKHKATYDRAPQFGIYSMASLTDNSFTQFEGIYELGQKLRLSLSRSLEVLEKLKGARTLRGEINFSELHSIQELELQDIRDFDVVSFDDGRESVLSHLMVGPKQGCEHVRLQKQKELLIQKFMQRVEISPSDEISEDLINESEELTSIERWALLFVSQLSDKSKEPVLESPPHYDTSKSLGWEVYHWCYTMIETYRLARSIKVRVSFNPQSLIKVWVSGYQSELNNWEMEIIGAFRDSKLPGEASKVTRVIKQEHMQRLKSLLELKL